MKLMTYNIRDGAGEMFGSVISAVNAENPDFLCLNEANGFDDNDNKKLKLFASKTNFPHYHLERCGDGRDYHVVILSRIPFKKIETIHPLTRAGIIGVVETPAGDIALCGTHLSPYSEDKRLDEAALILEALRPYDNKVILGDLNSLSQYDNYSQAMIQSFNPAQTRKFTTDGSVRYDVTKLFTDNDFIDTAVHTDMQNDITVPTASNQDAAHAHLRLDYILVSQPLISGVGNYKVIKNELTEKASDHYPVTVEVSSTLFGII